jgi:xanthine dehydrogenase molybdenum-binding subunit
MIVAEALGVPLDRVEVVNSDTAVKPWDVGVHASRTTFIAGNAALLAATELRQKLLALAGEIMEEPPERLELRDGFVLVKDRPERRLPYDKVVRTGHFREGGQMLAAEAFYDPPNEMLNKELRGNISAAYIFAAHAAVVEVEEATGRVEVLKFVAAHDVGRALNPPAAEGQVHGGIHMGLGYALAEQLVVDQGQLLTSTFMDYAILKADDMPEIVVRLIESVDSLGPFGAKGLGEAGAVPVGAAVANAIRDAVGIRLTELPMTPERIYRALQMRNTA